MKSAVHLLETHPDHVRIHKLLYFVYTKLWIADVKAIDGLSITRLIDLLLKNSDSIKHLETRLLNNAGQLNKADIYIQLAHRIIDTLRQHVPPADQPVALPYDQFQLRYAIMQVLTPYKAKAVLIALYSAYSASSKQTIPMQTLAKVSLDELLKKVMQLYPSLDRLESGLQQLNHFPTDIQSQERRQLGQTLKEVLRPYLQPQVPEPAESVEPSDPDPDSLCTLLMSPQKRNAVSPSMSALCPGETP